MGVVHVLANLTSRSPLLMTELRKLWFILDSNDISTRPRYIKTTANIWRLTASAANLTTTTGRSAYATSQHLGASHHIDRFTSMENAKLPHYNSR
eukprot:jgi/Tetstr1/460508/TSEL_005767.t1